MPGLNNMQLIGNLGADVEARYTANGTMVAEFRVAVNEGYTDKDGAKHDRTEWFRVVTYGNLAEIVSKYLLKGRQVYVQGRMQTRSWDGQDGQKHYITELIAQNVTFLGGGGQRDEGYQPAAPVARDNGGDIDPDDLPFHHDQFEGVLENGQPRWS